MSYKTYHLNPFISLLVLLVLAVLAVLAMSWIVPAGVLGTLVYVVLKPYPIVAAVSGTAVACSVYGAGLLGVKWFAARFEDGGPTRIWIPAQVEPTDSSHSISLEESTFCAVCEPYPACEIGLPLDEEDRDMMRLTSQNPLR